MLFIRNPLKAMCQQITTNTCIVLLRTCNQPSEGRIDLQFSMTTITATVKDIIEKIINILIDKHHFQIFRLLQKRFERPTSILQMDYSIATQRKSV